jgi:hypothetical protein
MTENPFRGSVLEKPTLIYNCDESGFEFDAINKIVAASRGAKHVPRLCRGQHEKITVLACASASGNSIPPLFIYKNKSGRVPNGMREDAPPGTFFVGQKSDWIDKDIYLKWFKEVFFPSIPSERPVLLVVDGHKSCVTADLIETAVSNKIIVFCLLVLHSITLHLWLLRSATLPKFLMWHGTQVSPLTSEVDSEDLESIPMIPLHCL